jgi:hypothetical protein
VDERPDAGTITDDRHPALQDESDDRTIVRDRCPGPVEESIPQGKDRQVHIPAHGFLDMSNRREGPGETGWRVRVEGSLFNLDWPTFSCERPPAEALRDEPAGTGDARSREQRVGHLRAEAIRASELFVELLEVPDAGERCELVNDGVGAGSHDGRGKSVAVERVRHKDAGTSRLDLA